MTDTPEEDTTEIRALWPFASEPKVGMVIHDAGVPVGEITAVYQEGDQWIVDMTLQGSYGVELNKSNFN
jgi:hypothetical protein